VRQPEGRAGGVLAWRARRRRQPGASPLLRSQHYHIIVFDQRGAGAPSRWVEITDNTTLHLIADLEKLRSHLGIDRWAVFGGSWGSTLAIAYAEAHAERCKALVLRGIFLCRKSEIDWFLYGMRAFAPEIWREFTDYLPAAERGDLPDQLLQAPDRS
jgi:proline iminopeptidase